MSATPAQTQKKELLEQITNQIQKLSEAGSITIPHGYNAPAKVQDAFLILSEIVNKDKKPALEVCSTASVNRAIRKMVSQGLDPMKTQCYFIVYGSQLNFQRSYMGSIALAKRIADVKEVNAHVIYKGDTFVSMINAETGRKTLVKHESPFENRSGEIIGAYAIVLFNDGSSKMEEMTISEIHQSWSQGFGDWSKGDSTHKKFPQEMAKKTVSNRALKTVINSVVEDENLSDDEEKISTEEETKQKIETKANTKNFDFDEAELVDDSKTEPKTNQDEPKQEGTKKTEAKPVQGEIPGMKF